MTKIFLTIILLIVLVPFGARARGRQNLPFPTTEDTALSRVDGEDITGWTFGED